MDTLSYKTVSVNKANANKQWLLVDADGQTLGRFCSKVAKMLRGKHKTNFTPHADCGDFVVVVNAEKISLGGTKWTNKKYIHHTGYPGGQRVQSARELYKKNPCRLVEDGIRGMLPKNKLGAELFRNLKVYNTPKHEHEAQKPTEININEFN